MLALPSSRKCGCGLVNGVSSSPQILRLRARRRAGAGHCVKRLAAGLAVARGNGVRVCGKRLRPGLAFKRRRGSAVATTNVCKRRRGSAVANKFQGRKFTQLLLRVTPVFPADGRMSRDGGGCVNEYLRGACACESVEALAAHVSGSDAVVVVWYACMCRGLRARTVGRSRVVCRRWSPGSGICRRHCTLRTVPAEFSSVHIRGRSKEREYERSVVRGAFRAGESKAVWGASVMGVYRGKCLQACVVDCFRGACRLLFGEGWR